MTSFQKENVRRMRSEGVSYAKIAASLGLSENTVKSYCKRNNIRVEYTLTKMELPDAEPETESSDLCKNCGKPIEHKPGIKPRKFCSDQCRTAWWNSHLDQVSRKSVYHLICAACGKPFDSYGNKNRKYCTHACYIKERFQKQTQPEVREA